MSIALSVVIKPSRLAFLLVGAICLSCVFVGVSIALSLTGEMSFAWRMLLCVICMAIGISGLHYASRKRTAHHIDISGIGQIRLVETTALVAPPRGDAPRAQEPLPATVRLMDDSTLWPFLMVLRLHTGQGRAKTVIVLPDSVGRADFKALSVACRWIVAHRNPAAHMHP